ncbi:MAG: hypothetical protein Q7S09_04260 [bacterium]|nr:hypothetical protein [bacterium]
MSTPQFLTEDQKRKIWNVIRENTLPDDRNPQEVIRDIYNGDEEAYLFDMARYHEVALDG